MTQQWAYCSVCSDETKTGVKEHAKAMKVIKAMAKVMAIICMFIFLIATCAMFRKMEDKAFTDTSMFCQVQDNAYWTVYYHKGTKVMWIRNKGTFGGTDMEILVDSDGNPMLWEK